MRPAPSFTLLCLSACVLTACGGGGGGSGSANYTIGGSVSGLTQLPGVVLENNGGDALTVSSNGSFTFTSVAAKGSAYNVTVQSSPSGETCQVTSGQGTVSGRVTGISVVCASIYAASGAANVASISVNPGPGSQQTFNIPLVSVKVCDPSNPNNCATINDVLVDTGSSGLRLISSALPAGFTLPPMADPVTPGNTISECMVFADGYSWGSVNEATVTIGGETTSQGIPIQIINSSSSPSPPVPSTCSNISPGLKAANTVDDFDANGVLGVGVFNQDCGSSCGVGNPGNDIYYTCSTTQCSSTGVTAEVANPVASFPTDHNGVIVQLPTVPTTGATGATGYLVFGIGTETASATEVDNSLNGATVLTLNSGGGFTTTFGSQTLNSSFIDSGSNALYFPQPSPQLATCQKATEFYCPTSNTTLTATNAGINGATTNESFVVANLNTIPDTNFAIDDIGAIAMNIPGLGTSYFDWGLPFFYGRTVFTAIEGMNAEGTTGPYYAY